jgi:hypothetical protein
MGTNFARPHAAAAGAQGRPKTKRKFPMIQFHAYRDNPLAPTAFVSSVGGIYRHNENLIRVTFINDATDPVVQSQLIWTPWAWLESQPLFDFAMREFRRGTFYGGGRLRTQ